VVLFFTTLSSSLESIYMNISISGIYMMVVVVFSGVDAKFSGNASSSEMIKIIF
jgi:hypothetical protein